jgi:SAM-dependent MidA family methyltransferase
VACPRQALHVASHPIVPSGPFHLPPIVTPAFSGNIVAAGIFDDPHHTVLVELGAGKGYLSAWAHAVR